ncbi:MAG: ABC transporter substrate-binding protein [Acidisphaera sp.]|nr:ABC transporter substrate-binding protein [Acidisphaera sp.]
MEKLVSPERRLLLAAAAAAVMPTRFAAAQGAHAANIAVIGEPGVLDPMTTLADLVNEIDQHFFETLYACDPSFHVAPVLAAAMPQISEDGKRYTIPLRENVPFHDGSVMTADDVVASLQRWLKLSPRAQAAAPSVEALSAPDPHTVQIALKQPYSPLIILLALFNGASAIMPKAIAAASGPLEKFVGTGPYRLLEHVPDRYIRVARFDKYASPPGKPNGFVGARTANVDELRFIPVGNPTTRADGLISGEYHFADVLTTESYQQLAGKPGLQQGTMITPGWVLLAMNTKAGLTSDLRIRQAALAAAVPGDMLAAAFGPPSLWTATGSIYPKGTDYFVADTPGYDTHDPAKARAMLKAAGYKGQPFRIFTTTQYDYMYKAAQVAGANLQDAGFTVDVQVMDWATLLQKRNDPTSWEAFVTSSPIMPDPTFFSIFNPNYAGWWDTPEKRAALENFVTAPNTEAKLAAWRRMHELFYSQVPSLLIGYYKLLYGISTKLQDFTPAQPPAFWNVSLAA